jgi:hypothetical protein
MYEFLTYYGLWCVAAKVSVTVCDVLWWSLTSVCHGLWWGGSGCKFLSLKLQHSLLDRVSQNNWLILRLSIRRIQIVIKSTNEHMTRIIMINQNKLKYQENLEGDRGWRRYCTYLSIPSTVTLTLIKNMCGQHQEKANISEIFFFNVHLYIYQIGNWI